MYVCMYTCTYIYVVKSNYIQKVNYFPKLSDLGLKYAGIPLEE